jgi:hypothetical protein
MDRAGRSEEAMEAREPTARAAAQAAAEPTAEATAQATGLSPHHPAAQAIEDDTVLDGNAVAGLLVDVFGSEMTDAPSQCSHCGNDAAVGTLMAYVRAPGVVLRCRVCTKIVLRVVVTPRGTYVDASGVARLRLPPRG